MRTLLWTCGLWLCTLGPGVECAPGVDLTGLVRDAQPSVVTVLAYDKDGRLICQGSGFFVSEEGQAITCYHVLEGAFRAEVKTFDGERYPVKAVPAMDRKADLVKVHIDVGDRPVRAAEVQGLMPAIAERIVVIGSPLGLEQTVSEGIVSGIRPESARGKSFQISASTSKGSSGGPVLNMNGQVVGIVSSQAIEGQNLNFAVSAEQALKLIRSEVQRQDQATADPMIGTESSEELFQRARSCLLEGHYDQALIRLRAVGRDSADFRPALLLSGLCYAKLGLNLEAVRVYSQAIQLDPADVEAHFNLGLRYSGIGQHGKAADAYRSAVRIAPGRADIWLCLGMALSQVGEYKDAIDAYRAAVRIDDDYADAHYGIGLAHHKLGNCDDAAEAYKRALEHRPQHSAARFGLGLALAALGQKDMALEQYALLKNHEEGLAEKLLAAVGKQQ